MKIAEGVTYRWLRGVDATEEEWSRIDEILATRGWMSLNRETSILRIAEDASGKLVGFFVGQAVPYLGPEWVAPSARGTGIAQKLGDDMVGFLTEKQCRGWLVIADSPHSAKMAKERGMTLVESPVYWTT